MAAQTIRLKASLIRLGAAFAALFATAIGVFLLTAWIGSSIARNSNWSQPERGVDIMVETNGVHTALVVPLVNAQKDWRDDFPVEDIAASAGNYTHLSISWGEREVFLNTPSWSDLSPATVLRIIGVGGDGLLHVAHYVRPAPSVDLRRLTITAEQYRKLVTGIEQSILPPEKREQFAGYYAQDVFYSSNGRYSATNTCNQWVSDTLALAGVKTGWWTPMAGGVMKWVPRPK